jgi:hypothetical protein
VQQPGDQKFQRRMLNVDRESILGCLKHRVEPTNSRAERAIRPAVISRMLSCGNKTQRGVQTWEILASQCATLHQQGKDLLAAFIQIVSPHPPPRHQCQHDVALSCTMPSISALCEDLPESLSVSADS